jgi:hypothetical protein
MDEPENAPKTNGASIAKRIWRRLQKGMLLIGLLAVIAVFVVPLMFMFVAVYAMMPRSDANTQSQMDAAPAYFQRATKLPFPEGAIISHVSKFSIGGEIANHLILDVSSINLNKWIKLSKPFGKHLKLASPRTQKMTSHDGLPCARDDASHRDKPAHRLVNVACELMTSPREVLITQQQISSGRMITAIVDQKAKMIWLQEQAY